MRSDTSGSGASPASARDIQNSETPLLTSRSLIVALIVVACGLGFVTLSEEVFEGETRHIDEWLLRSLRRNDDPAVPIGPSWLREAGMDITALGSPAILVLMISAVLGLMQIRGKRREMALTIVISLSGSLFALLLKYLLGRDRPTVVPHLREVTTPSFPSGHAMVSAVVFMTLGILLTKIVEGRRAKLYCLAWALLLTILVGISRIYLGVHYPTDVVAGWLAGIGWALGCYAFLQMFDRMGSRKPDSIDSGTNRNRQPR